MIGVVPPSEDPCAILAARIVARHRAQLPDLTGAVVLLPGHAGAARLRECLIAEAAGHGFEALLGPIASTMRDWVLQRTRADDRGVPGEHARELILVEALHRHRKLFGGADPWHLADELLALFRELTLSGETLPEGESAFIDRLARGYGSRAALEPLGITVEHRPHQLGGGGLDGDDWQEGEHMRLVINPILNEIVYAGPLA